MKIQKVSAKQLTLLSIGVLLVCGLTAALYLENKRASLNNSADTAEKKFIQQMIPHHEGAIQMAKQAEQQATTPEIKQLAVSIILAQQKEIDEMREWYKQWWRTEVPKVAADPHAGHSAEPAEGADTFDEGFISMMIPHHDSAIEMAREVLPKARHKQIKDLANSIIKSQGAEIEQMRVIIEKIKGTSQVLGPVEVITYSDQGFSRPNISIGVGTSIRWENQRTEPGRPMWIASDVHPDHTIYPEFDQARLVMREPEPQDSPFTFTFNKPGRWEYHDHYDPDKKGVVIVRR